MSKSNIVYVPVDIATDKGKRTLMEVLGEQLNANLGVNSRQEVADAEFVAVLSCGCTRPTTTEEKKEWLEENGTCWKCNPESRPQA